MKTVRLAIPALLLIPSFVLAQFSVDSSTVGLWHFDEESGTLVADASLFHNNGTAYGATIVPGRFGNGRYFNGSGAFVDVPNPVNGSLNFSPDQSFTIEAWFKSTAGGVQEIVRRGLAPYPGYNLRLNEGHVEGEIGNRWDGTPPDTVLRITSDLLFNDGQWHFAALVRDREAHKLFLYVDNAPAARPMDDLFPYALSNPFSLNIGYWAALGGVEYFNGTLDEIRISRTARHPMPIASDTVALWHFDEPSGQNVHDSSPNHNDGTADGTTIIPSEFGNARHFNGHGDYVYVPNSNTLSFSASQSFTIDAWFKTTAADTGEIVRRGLAPFAGYLLRIFNGHVQGTIGDREDLPLPHMLVRITSTALYNDGGWHHAVLVRDREEGRLFLYVDGAQAASPVVDNFALPITSDRPLTLGRWENFTYPTYFAGDIDEVTILGRAVHPVSISTPTIHVSPLAIDFGSVTLGTTSFRPLEIANAGVHDTLFVGGIISSDSTFSAVPNTLVIPPGSAQQVQVSYLPQVTRTDTATLAITSNDPNHSMVRVSLRGTGIQLGASPIISSILDIPNDQGKQVRVIWHRSLYDGIDDSLHVTSYNLWRRVDDGPPELLSPYPPEGSTVTRNGHTFLHVADALWDFIATIPAVQFAQYAFVAPTIFDSTVFRGVHWSVFTVSAHTTGGMVFFSLPDSGYSIDNLPPRPPIGLSAVRVEAGVCLTWEASLDPDFNTFVLHRSIQPNFVPNAQTIIGTSSSLLYNDTHIAGLPAVYYKLAAVDSSGNQSEYSEEVGFSLTDAGGNGKVPTEFGLHQNYPNPFNPSTTLVYDVPTRSHITLKVYNTLGQEVTTLVDDDRLAGRYSVVWDARGIASGTYLTRMTADGKSITQRMILLK